MLHSVDDDSLASLTQSQLNRLRRSQRPPTRYQCRSKPLYDNCKLLGPDGTLLAMIDRKKSHWYHRKNLAILTADPANSDALVCQLKFQPRGSGNQSCEYGEKLIQFYNEDKFNLCVACGVSDGLLRHYIVPSSYRKIFPTRFKCHSSHDVCLLCTECHLIAEQSNTALSKSLYIQYGVDVSRSSNTSSGSDDEQQFEQVYRNAQSVRKHGSKMPSERRQQLVDSVIAWCRSRAPDGSVVWTEAVAIDQVTEIYHQCQVELKASPAPNPSTPTTFEHLVDAIIAEAAATVGQSKQSRAAVDAGVHALCRRFRQSFLDALAPQFLSSNFDVDAIKITNQAHSSEDEAVASDAENAKLTRSDHSGVKSDSSNV